MKIDGPEPVLRACIDRIEAAPEFRENLLAVTHVPSFLRYNDRRLLDLFLAGRKSMLRFPVLDQIIAARSHKHILRVLTIRFGPVGGDLIGEMKPVVDDEPLDELVDAAAGCATLDAFRERLREVIASLPVEEDDYEDPAQSEPS